MKKIITILVILIGSLTQVLGQVPVPITNSAPNGVISGDVLVPSGKKILN